jgi:flagellar basal body rod protein FlgG
VVNLQGTGPITIASDGTVTQDGNTIGQLQVVDFPGGAGLTKQGSSYFRVADPTVQPSAAPGIAVEQGKLEASNTGTAESAVRLIGIMRQFEMMQKAVSMGLDMNRQAVEQVAKVGS